MSKQAYNRGMPTFRNNRGIAQHQNYDLTQNRRDIRPKRKQVYHGNSLTKQSPQITNIRDTVADSLETRKYSRLGATAAAVFIAIVFSSCAAPYVIKYTDSRNKALRVLKEAPEECKKKIIDIYQTRIDALNSGKAPSSDLDKKAAEEVKKAYSERTKKVDEANKIKNELEKQIDVAYNQLHAEEQEKNREELDKIKKEVTGTIDEYNKKIIDLYKIQGTTTIGKVDKLTGEFNKKIDELIGKMRKIGKP